ncbi:MAG: S8 family serine peptidase, partial [Caldilineaceae bacterium]|nr:S8 family serine peptidase [Caldilineaceae bacterium]
MHRKRRFSLLVTLLLLLSLLTSSVAWAQVPAQPAPPVLHLQAASFAPAAGQQPDLPPGLTIAGYNANVRGAYIVQFGGPIEQAWRDQLTGLGAEILGYLPDFAYKVRMNPAQASQAATLPGVLWVGVFQPAYKLSPDLKLDGHRLYRIRLERGADAGLVTAAIATSGAELLARNGNVIVVVADAAQVTALAQVSDIAWIENFVFKVKHNESGGGVIMGGNAALAAGFDGSTQIAAVADTGLGGGTASTAHADVPAGRIQAIYNWTSPDVRFCYRVRPDGPQDVDSGHGTHVALSVVGDGGAAGEGRGVAPAAKLVFQAVEEYLDIYAVCTDPNTPDGYYLIGIPDDLHELFQQAYGAGARTHSNSWGSAQAGVYTLDSQNTDDFIWQTRDMLVTFSAGNEGIDANSDGIIDNDSIGSPATAKNVLTVGASENQRADGYPCDTGLGYQSHDLYQPGQTCGSMGGQNILGTYGGRWPADYPANPIAGDLTAGNQEQMAAFSSRGPTNDGRIKPDIVAPGTWVLSGYSSLYQEGYGDPVNPQNNAYQVDG